MLYNSMLYTRINSPLFPVCYLLAAHWNRIRRNHLQYGMATNTFMVVESVGFVVENCLLWGPSLVFRFRLGSHTYASLIHDSWTVRLA